mgnify:CR=1 FL=1
MAENNKPTPQQRRAGDSSGSKTRHREEFNEQGEAGKFTGKKAERLEKRLDEKGGETHPNNFKNREPEERSSNP